MWYIIGLAWIAVMVGIVSTYNRKQRRRGAERAAQMAALLADLKANPPRAALDGVEKAAVAAVASPEFSKKQRLLSQPIALLYYVFRAGLPDHEIFAGLALGDVLDVEPALNAASREQLLRKIAQQRLDLVVCTKKLEIVAAVVVQNPVRGMQAESAQFATQCLQAAGIRVVSIDPAAPPRHHQVNTLIYS